nr:TRIC cation channel family protein [Agromyces archimandritae]
MESSALFTIPLWLELTAVAVGGIQGAMFAARLTERQIDLLGIGLIGVLVALGGGLLRDLLINQLPAMVQNNWYLPTATGAALFGMLLFRIFNRLNGLIIVLDALTIGAFGAIGTTKALAWGVPVVPAVFVGVASAVGGSILRDIALNLPIALMHVGSLYAVAAAVGTILIVVLVAFGVPMLIAGIACVVVTTLIRLGSVRWGWSLPEQRAISGWRVWRRA